MMSRLIKKRSGKAGLPPGTLVHVGERKAEKVKIQILDYDEAQFEEKEAKTIEECLPFKDTSTVTWINIDGIHPKIVQERLGHSSITITLDTYSHVAPGLQQAAANLFDEAFTTKYNKTLSSKLVAESSYGK